MLRHIYMILACILFCTAASAEQKTHPIMLTIQNDALQAVRCQFVLAHFVTFDLATIAGGDATTVALQRTADGTLSLVHDGRSMATENVLCGLDEGWATSKHDLDLQPLRTGSRGDFTFACTFEEGLRCPVKPEGT